MKVVIIKFILLGKINVKKRDMYYKAKHLGLTDPRVVTCSQELDTLLNKYQEILIYQDKFEYSHEKVTPLVSERT